MSDYAHKLSQIGEKKNKLIQEEQKLIEGRKKEIGNFAQKFGLLTVSDELIAGVFSEVKKALETHSDKIKEWETLGGRFRPASKNTPPAQKRKSGPAETGKTV